MSSTVTVVLPKRSPSQNELDRGRSHVVRAAIRRRWRTLSALCARTAMAEYGFPPAREGERRLVFVTRYSPGELDDGNFVGGMKPIVDGLVDAGALWDDRRACVSIQYNQKKCKRGRDRTEMVVKRGE